MFVYKQLLFHTGSLSWHNGKFARRSSFLSVQILRSCTVSVFSLGTFCQLWGLKTMQPDLCSPPLFECMPSNILCQDMGYIRGSLGVPGAMLNMETDGLQLLQDICLLWVTPLGPDAKQNGWRTTNHIHLSHLAVTTHLTLQQCLMLF